MTDMVLLAESRRPPLAILPGSVANVPHLTAAELWGLIGMASSNADGAPHGKPAVLHHLFVAAPGWLYQPVKTITIGHHARKRGGGVFIPQVVAADADNRIWEIRCLNTATCGENLEPSLCKANCDASTDTTTCSGHQRYVHVNSL
jgi:hypothetical protein